MPPWARCADGRQRIPRRSGPISRAPGKSSSPQNPSGIAGECRGDRRILQSAARALSRAAVARRWPCANDLADVRAAAGGQVPARARDDDGRRFLGPRLARDDRRRRRCAAGRAFPWPRRQLGIAIRSRADGRARGSWMARSDSAFSRLQRRNQSAAEGVSLRRPRRGRRDARSDSCTRESRYRGSRRRRLARWQCADQLARARGSRCRTDAHVGRGGIDAARPDRRGSRHRQRHQPDLRMAFPVDAETEKPGDGAAISGQARRSSLAPHLFDV